jgi:outer membrane protein assembly factor BamB
MDKSFTMISVLFAFTPFWVKKYEQPNLRMGETSLKLIEPYSKNTTFHFTDFLGNGVEIHPNGKEIKLPLSKNTEVIYYDSNLFIDASGQVTFAKKTFFLGSPIAAAPIQYKDFYIFLLRNDTVVALDFEGKQKWKVSHLFQENFHTQKKAPMLLHENSVYIACSNGVIKKIDVETGKIYWQNFIDSVGFFKDIDLQPKIFKNFLVASSFSGPTVFIDILSGKNVHVFDYNLLDEIIETETGLLLPTPLSLFVLDKTYKIIQEISLGSRKTHFRKFSKGYLTADNQGKIYYLDHDFKEKYSFEFGMNSSIISKILIQENSFAFYSSKNRLYFFQEKKL